jgi:hypothetical protein
MLEQDAPFADAFWGTRTAEAVRIEPAQAAMNVNLPKDEINTGASLAIEIYARPITQISLSIEGWCLPPRPGVFHEWDLL